MNLFKVSRHIISISIVLACANDLDRAIPCRIINTGKFVINKFYKMPYGKTGTLVLETFSCFDMRHASVYQTAKSD